MRSTCLVLVLCSLPLAAAAQPGATAPADDEDPVLLPEATPAPAPPPDEPAPVSPDRRGFTLSLDVGAGFTRVAPDVDEAVSGTGPAGIDLGLGGWLSPSVALMVRLAGQQFTTEGGTTLVAGYLGPSLQLMVSDRVFVAGGLGLGVLTDGDGQRGDRGVGLDLRVGIELAQWRQHALHIAVEAMPSWYDGGAVSTLGFQVGWQYL